MDLRNPVLAILCGGAPAPGINGVISSITIEALNSNCSVLGFFEGFKQLKFGKSMVMSIEFSDVARIHSTGGSLIRTSKQQLTTPLHVENCLRVLQHHRVRYLVTIGGTQTAYSASLLATAARQAGYKLSIIHAPKSIFSDFGFLSTSSGEGIRTVGFSTACEVGTQLVHNFSTDARTMLRWYILVCMGQKAGHLTLGIGKAGAATVTILAEDYQNRTTPLTFNELATTLEGAIYKRRAMNKEYGVACISEGLISCFDPKEMTERFGDIDTAHSELGRHLVIELSKRFAKRTPPIDQTILSRNIGFELRSAPPNASDITLTRDLGFACVRVLMTGGHELVVTLKGGQIVVIPFSSIVDPAHASTQIRMVDTNSLSYQVTQSYSIMLRQPDLQDTGFLQKLARAANMTASEFLLQFQHIAAPMPSFRQSQASYEFMRSAFPGLPGEKAPAGVQSLTQQTQQQLQIAHPASTHIVAPGQPVRKGSDRESISSSPPTQLLHSQQPPQVDVRANSAGTTDPPHPHTTTAAAAAAAAASTSWFQASPIGFGVHMQRLNSNSPAPPPHLLANPETPRTALPSSLTLQPTTPVGSAPFTLSSNTPTTLHPSPPLTTTAASAAAAAAALLSPPAVPKSNGAAPSAGTPGH